MEQPPHRRSEHGTAVQAGCIRLHGENSPHRTRDASSKDGPNEEGKRQPAPPPRDVNAGISQKVSERFASDTDRANTRSDAIQEKHGAMRETAVGVLSKVFYVGSAIVVAVAGLLLLMKPRCSFA